MDGGAEPPVAVPSGASGQWEYLAAGDELDSTTVVRTYSQSSLDIRLQTGSVVRVMEDTLFSLSSLGSERIEMDVRQGEVVSRLARLTGTQDMNIRTPSAVAGVRGTELVLTVAREGTVVFGLSGAVEVTNPEFPDQVMRLGVHQKTGVSLGIPPSDPEPMSADEIDRYRRILNSLNENQLQTVGARIEIVGHTADIGTMQSQISLSTMRAESVKEYLVELGIPESRLLASGVGSSQPLTEDNDPESLRLNRRVEFRVSYQ